jgi:threonine/homoserine/homoserine lactone efflux protein
MVQLSATRGFLVAGWFALGCMLAEVVCVFVCVRIMDRVSQSRVFVKSLEWVSLLIIVWLVVSSFSSIKNPHALDVPIIPRHISPFLFGFLLMAVNPVQIPFWVGWTTILMERKLLRTDSRQNGLYMIGIAAGSVAASILFIAGGRGIASWIEGREVMFQWTFGLALILIAVVQVAKIVRNKQKPA